MQQHNQKQLLEIQERISQHPLGSVLFAYQSIVNQALSGGLFKDTRSVIGYHAEIEKLKSYILNEGSAKGVQHHNNGSPVVGKDSGNIFHKARKRKAAGSQGATQTGQERSEPGREGSDSGPGLNQQDIPFENQ